MVGFFGLTLFARVLLAEKPTFLKYTKQTGTMSGFSGSNRN